MKISQSIAAALMLAVCGLCSGASGSPKPVLLERVLQFPDDSLGTLRLQDENDGQENEYALWGQDSGWKDSVPAKGRVVIPQGKQVMLIVSSEAWTAPEKLDALKQLKPDDLNHIILSAGYSASPETPPPTDACIPYITHLTGLKTLDLSQSLITEQGLARLTALTSLERFYTPEGLTDRGLSEIAKIRSLKAMYIGSLGQNRLSDRALAMLQRLPNLKDLGLADPKLTDDALGHVAGIKSLEWLSLRPSMGFQPLYTDEGLKHLRACLRLKTVYLQQLNISDIGLQHLSKIRTIEKVHLYWIETVTDRGIHALADLPRLKEFHADRAYLTDESLRTLSNIPALESLTLSRNGISEQGIGSLQKLKQVKRLTLLSNIPGTDLTDHALKVISGFENLEELHIGGNGFTDQGMKSLGRLERLRRLSLSTAPGVTDAGLSELKRLRRLETLQWPRDTQITLAGINQLNGLKALKSISFGQVRKGDATLDISGMESLESIIFSLYREINRGTGGWDYKDSFSADDWACFAHLKKLHTIEISGKGVGDASLAHLTHLPNLSYLNISGPTKITDKGLTYLLGKDQLARIIVNHGRFTDNALQTLAAIDALNWIELHSDTAFSNPAIEELKAKKPHLVRLILVP